MDLWSTNTLNRVVADLKGQTQFLLDRYFGAVQVEQAEEIHFDVMDGKRRISPFVSFLVEGQIVASPGYRTGTLKPAYVKDKRVFDMLRPFKRAAGENLGGTMSPMDRLRAMIARDMEDQVSMLNRRMEVMAGEALATGKVTIVGDKYPQAIVDFGRAAGNTIVAGTLWSAAGSHPLNDLQDWGQIALQSTGVFLVDVIMPPGVWKVFRDHTDVKDRLNLYRGIGQPPSLQLDAQSVGEGGAYVGNIDGFNIYVYSSWYIDPADSTEKPIIPADAVLMVSPQLEGVRAYGAIRDEEAGLQAVPYYVKSWVEPDPSVRFLMLQSAPLVVPYRPNASLKAKVI
jgi:hypothetical protein